MQNQNPKKIPVDVRVMNSLATGMFVLGFLLILGFAAWFFVLDDAFKLQGVVVQGDVERSNAKAVQSKVIPKLKGNFFTADLEVAKRTFEEIPWVRKAVVHRSFPNQLRVQIEEHQATALWGVSRDNKLVNQYGELFTASWEKVNRASMPLLTGPEERVEAIWQTYQSLQKQIEALHLQVVALTLSKQGSWKASLNNGASLQLGRGEPAEIDARVSTFVHTLQGVGVSYVESIPASLLSADLRYPNGYAVKLKAVGMTDVVPAVIKGKIKKNGQNHG